MLKLASPQHPRTDPGPLRPISRAVWQVRTRVRDDPDASRRLVDRCGAALRRIGVGDLERYGLGKAAWGPFTARRPAVIDAGFLEELKRGHIAVQPDVSHFDALAPERSILVAPTDAQTLGGLLAIAEPIARKPAREIILTRLLPDDSALADAMVALRDQRDALLGRGLPARVAAFTSPDPGEDLVRMATEQDVDLLLIETTDEITAATELTGTLATVLEEAPCDVAVVALRTGADDAEQASAPVFVPFGGSDNDWAAVEIGAWVATSRNAPLRLLGTRADRGDQKRDASRLLASVSLMIQQVTGVIAEPLLIAPGADGVIEASHQAQLIVTGLSDDWRKEGIGDVRATIARDATPPVMLIRGGLRPGGLAPDHTLTRFTWTIAGSNR